MIVCFILFFIITVFKMALLRTIFALLITASAVTSFAPVPTSLATTTSSIVPRFEPSLGLFEEAIADYSAEYPGFAKWGWGPSVHAEKWNGRHAMFGWFFIIATAYAQGHNLIPDAGLPLNFKEWGTLATISGKQTITQERAVVLIANLHCFMIGLCATICPLPFSDPLLLDPTQGEMYDRAMETKPYGVFIPMKTGLTEEAEMMNGRMAMFGLVALIVCSCAQNKPMLDVVNEWAGGLIF